MQREGQAILVAIGTLVFLCIIVIILFVIFQKRKNALILKQKESKKNFEQEIAKTQIEIREQTFRNISWELHDNIGQLLTLAKIQLQNKAPITEVSFTLDKSIKELRILSKAINPEALKNITLPEAIHQEIERLNRLKYIEATLEIRGQEKKMKHNIEIVFFRILQEFFSNTIKHAKATKLKVIIHFKDEKINIYAKDNGRGFNKDNTEIIGIGLTNISKRAQLIGTEAVITSVIGKGTKLHISYNY